MGLFHQRLMKAYAMMHKRVMNEAQKLGLTAGQPKILEYLLTQEGAEQYRIAKHCEIEPATVGSILNRMEASGLVERRRLGTNRRSLYVYLTEKARKAALEVENIFAKAESEALEGIGAEEREKMSGILTEVYKNLSKTEEDHSQHIDRIVADRIAAQAF